MAEQHGERSTEFRLLQHSLLISQVPKALPGRTVQKSRAAPKVAERSEATALTVDCVSNHSDNKASGRWFETFAVGVAYPWALQSLGVWVGKSALMLLFLSESRALLQRGFEGNLHSCKYLTFLFITFSGFTDLSVRLKFSFSRQCHLFYRFNAAPRFPERFLERVFYLS